jgi:pimeloyl-ACP methyl ester carboxylesterase
MTRPRHAVALLLTIAALLLGLPAAAAHAQQPPTRYAGTLPNGATWIADVPADWNGTILLYSHGYNPGPVNPPNNSPNQPTADALLARGYALAGSSYSRLGWALATAPEDQLATLTAVQRVVGRASRVIAFGTSMGGLVTGRLAQRAGERIDGALATCGIMGGGVDLHNYQLDGLHALNELLLPGRQVKLVRFASFDEAVATVQRLTATVQQAQTTPEGRARIALAAAYFHLPGWFPGLPNPADDYAAQEVGQYHGMLASLFLFETGRFDVEQSSGGNPSWNVRADYRRLLAQSGHADQVRSLYQAAGLDLRTDLRVLTRTADVAPDLDAVARLRRTSTLSGRLEMPVLTIHTTNDALVPVQHEEEYAEDVRQAGDRRLLRQAYVDRPGHCTFTPAELVAGVETIAARVETGRWGSSTRPQRLQALAESLDLGDAAFIRFRPGEFLGDRPLSRRIRHAFCQRCR